MILSELLRAVAQIATMSIIPVVWWLVTARKKVSFFAWVGLKKSVVADKRKFTVILVAALVVTASMSLVLEPMLPDDIQLAGERFSGLGFKAFVPAIIFSFFATGLAEEVLFRGFLGKRLIGKLGFIAGNTIQAVLFCLLHGATMFPVLDIAIPMLVISFTGLLGWLMGCINEKAGGSIIPSWCLHGAANLYATTVTMFELL